MSIFDFFRPQKEKKPAVKWIWLGGAIISYDLSYEVYFKFYELNPFVWMSINKRSNDVWSNGWALTKKGQDEEWKEKLYNDDFKELIKYSTNDTPKWFFKRLVRDYDITWNAYIYIVRDDNKKAIWMQILDPRYIKPVATEQGELVWYVQNLNWITIFLPDEIWHIKEDNDIRNEIVWKSKMTSLFTDVETDQEARDSNLAFFKNNQTPSSIVIIDPEFDISNIDDEKAIRKKIKEMFEWWKYKWWKNKHRSMMAQWIKDVIKIQDKISDMEFLNLRKFTRDLVFWVFEVPKSMFWFTDDVNYSNWVTQYDIYFNNIEALEKKFSEFLTKVLKEFDEEYIFVFLMDDLRRLMAKAEIAWSLYKDKWLLTLNESRKIIQYDEVEDWDRFYEAKSITLKEEEKDEN